jgi:hypothetical protein
MGYAEADNSGAAQSLLIIPAGIPRFEGARFIASNNTWSSFYADGAPIPDATLHGYLSEGSRTNLLLQSAVPATQNVTVTAVAHTISMWGTGTCTLSGTGSGTLTGTGVNDRVQLTFTPTAGTLTLTFAGTNTNGQIEAGAFASSYIPTTTAAVTRSADVLTYLTDGNVNANAGSFYTEYIPISVTGAYHALINIFNGSVLNCLEMYSLTSGGAEVIIRDGSGVQADVNIGLATIAVLSKYAIVYRSDYANAFFNGLIGTGDTVVHLPTQQSLSPLLSIASRPGGGSRGYGTIRNIKIYTKALKDSKLIEMTR